MHIGFSLFTDIILEKSGSKRYAEWPDTFTEINSIFRYLKEEGVSHIEIKLPGTLSESDIYNVLGKVTEAGFGYTFHAPGGFVFPDEFENYITLLEQIVKISNSHFDQKATIIFHGLSSSTNTREDLLRRNRIFVTRLHQVLAKYDVLLAFEILRDSDDNGKLRTGTSYQEVIDLISPFPNGNIGVCWDFGHGYSQSKRGIHEEIPPAEFLKLVRHTHVHDYKNKVTHLPLGQGQVPYQIYIQRLVDADFSGIFNLELNPGRIKDPENFQSYIIQSIRLLKRTLTNIESTTY